MTVINLNADMGESYGHFSIGNDARLMRIIKSASIACGFHAGEPTVMATAVRLAKDNGGFHRRAPGLQRPVGIRPPPDPDERARLGVHDRLPDRRAAGHRRRRGGARDACEAARRRQSATTCHFSTLMGDPL